MEFSSLSSVSVKGSEYMVTEGYCYGRVEGVMRDGSSGVIDTRCLGFSGPKPERYLLYTINGLAGQFYGV
jgi:hypothetical protein